jgi:rRNA maturation endonuclease Nob1
LIADRFNGWASFKFNLFSKEEYEIPDNLIKLKLMLEEILKLPNIRLDIKNYKGELANLIICHKCFYASTIDANFCENCGTSLK